MTGSSSAAKLSWMEQTYVACKEYDKNQFSIAGQQNLSKGEWQKVDAVVDSATGKAKKIFTAIIAVREGFVPQYDEAKELERILEKVLDCYGNRPALISLGARRPGSPLLARPSTPITTLVRLSMQGST
jgi:hypothetical protein